jgi:hypothetical protein
MEKRDLTLGIEELEKLAGYAHWIPALKGFQQSYLATTYPDWDWNQIIPQLIKERIVVVNSVSSSQKRLGNGLSISIKVQKVTITLTESGLHSRRFP